MRARERRLRTSPAPRGGRARAGGSLMASRHLSCQDCRIRLPATAPEIALLDGRCPMCGANLTPVPLAAGVVGFRSFDLDVLSGQAAGDRLAAPVPPTDLAARREALPSRDCTEVDRW